jgi:hypothetical protein
MVGCSTRSTQTLKTLVFTAPSTIQTAFGSVSPSVPMTEVYAPYLRACSRSLARREARAHQAALELS